MVYGMNKMIRILEVPLLLLILAMFSFDYDGIGIGVFLIVISVLRLWVNAVTDDTIHKK
jgi:hypothetical protein